MKRAAFELFAVKMVACLMTMAWASNAMAAEPALPVSPATTPVAGVFDSPRIRFAETVFDFGKAVGGEVVKHDFIFTNTGSLRLTISEVKSTCGCTATPNMSRQVEPGKTGIIPLEFYTENYSGPVAKTVTVVCNDTNQPPPALQVKGTIWRPIEVTPKYAVLSGLLDSPSNSFTIVNITNKQDEPLTLSEPVSNNRMIAAELKTNRLGQDYQLLVKLVPPLGSGNVFGEISLKTSAPKMPVLKISTWAVAQPAVTVMPPKLVLPANPVVNSVTQYVSIRSIWSNPLTLSEPVFNAKGASLDIKELQPGRYYTMVIVFPAGFKMGAGEQLELSVKSNHPQFPIIKVPITLRPDAAQAATLKPASALSSSPAAQTATPLSPAASPH